MFPTCGPRSCLWFLSPRIALGAPKMARVMLPLCPHVGHVTISDFCPGDECWGPQRRWGRCSHFAHLWARCPFLVFVAALSVGDPQVGRGDVDPLPTCGPRSYFCFWGPRWALGTTNTGGVVWPLCPHVGHVPFLIFVAALSVADPQDGKGDVATLRTCGLGGHF